MPPENPEDDFSRLPTADSAGGMTAGERLWKSEQGKTRSRIGPASTSPPPVPAQSGPLSPEWQELLEMQDAQVPAQPLTQPPPSAQDSVPAAGPRRSVIARKTPPVESSESAASPPPPPAKPAPRRSLIARRSELPSKAPAESFSSPPENPARPPAESRDAGERPSEISAPPAEPPRKSEPPRPIAKETAPRPSKPLAKVPARARSSSTGSESKDKSAAPKTTSETDQSTEKAKTPENPSDKSSTQDHPDTQSQDPAQTPASEDKGLTARTARMWKKYWDQWGGRALAASLAVHALLLLSAAWIVVSQVQEKQVDFLSGGGTKQGAEAAAALQHRVQQKKKPWLKKPVPMRKLAVANSINSLVLPDDAPDLLDIPEASSLLGGGKLSGGMGLAGSGGGFGKGMGIGGASGVTFQPFSLFGMQVKAKKLAAVLDVSGSMAPHLPRVITEVDKVAKGSVVVLYIGCGLEPPPPRGLDGKNVIATSTPDFDKFWRLLWQTGGATLAEARSYRPPAGEPMPSQDLYNLLKKRPRTYFLYNVGISYAWLALLSDQVRDADGLYWFSDFQDNVDFRQVRTVRENLEQRKQRLYAHAYFQGGSFDLIKSQLVEPTQGDYVLEQ
ncbi:MAG TPA: hypothetical protein DIT13_09925 [Verrucomicrobiales bacterium]|nr:hypothetical protein [Verrucomicrobiales bacterium]